jgi:glutaminyl-peptide cyclotransferase
MATWAVCAVVVCMWSADAHQNSRAPIWRHDVVRAYPHDPEAFTQGLVYRDGFLYESTGLNGQSSLRRVALETGKVVQRQSLDRRYFAEGLASWGPHLLQLTWDTGVGFVYDRASFRLLRTFTYAGEGWGLADDGRQLVMSDGTPTLRFLDPATFAVTRRVTVREGSAPVDELNELEVVRGLVYANVWQSERIAIISPDDGRVVAWLDLSKLAPKAASADAVLNGIAYDAAGDRLFVTGKLWPQLFEIKVRRP